MFWTDPPFKCGAVVVASKGVAVCKRNVSRGPAGTDQPVLILAIQHAGTLNQA